MNTKNTTDWMQLIQECRTSGLSDREWCSQNDIPASTFYYHIKRLRKQACDIPVSVSRKAAVRQEVVRLDIIDELPRAIGNEQLSSRTHPGPPALPENAAVLDTVREAVSILRDSMRGARTCKRRKQSRYPS